jgi:hypothetical protein
VLGLLLREALVPGAAGLGYQGLDTEFGEHVRGRFHLGCSADGMAHGAVRDPLQGARVEFAQLGRDVLA